MHLIWKSSTRMTEKQLIMLRNSLTNTYQLGTLAFLHFQTNPLFKKKLEYPCLFSMPHIFKTNPFNDYEQLINCIERHTKCKKAHASERKAPHLNVAIKHLGNYIQNHPYSLNLMAKIHTPLLATMTDSIPINMPSYLFGMQMLTSNQYSQSMSYINISQNMHPNKKKIESFDHMLCRISLTSPNVDPTTSSF